MKDLVVQLLLKTGNFSSDLKQAKGQIQNFQKGCQTTGKSVSAFSQALGINVGTLAKFGGVIGAAALAGKAFKGVMEGNQKTSDAFAATMYTAKNAVGELAYAVGTFDFSNFNMGLSNLIARGREAAIAIDQLGNTIMSYNVVRAKAQSMIAEAKAVKNDPNATKEQIDAANKQMEEGMRMLKESAEVAIDDYVDTLIKEMAAKGLQISGEGAVELIEKWITMDATKGREAAKKSAEDAYKIYQDEALKVQAKYSSTRAVGTSVTGGVQYAQVTDTSNPEYIREMEQLNEQYKDAIAYNTILNKLSDEQLDKLVGKVAAMYNIKTEVANMTTQQNRIEKPQGGGGGSTKTKEQEPEPEKDSLNYWKKIQAEATKARDNAVKYSTAWADANKLVIESEKEIKKLQEDINKPLEGSLNYWEKMRSEATQTMNSMVEGSEEWVNANEDVKKAEKEIETIQQNRQGIQEGSLKQMQSIVSKTQEELSKLKEGTTEWINKKAELDKYSAELDNLNKKMTQDANKQKLAELLKVENPTIENMEEIVSLLYEMRKALAGTDTEGLKAIDAQITQWQNRLNKVEFKAPDTSSWDNFNQAMANTATIVNSMANAFQKDTELTAASILQMVATSLPALGSLISAISALATAESVEAGVAGVAKAVSTSKHWIEAIAAVASVGAAVASAIAAAKKQDIKPQRYASGGIVPGTSYTGDRVSAQVNSGEMILNRSQQANLFKMINSGIGAGGREVTFHISGTELVGVLNNQNKKNRIVR